MGSGAATREAPQAPQNRWSGGFTWVQAGQARASAPPQAPQKRLAAGFALPHDGQVTSLGLRRASVANDKRLPANGSGASARASRSVLIPRTTPNHTWRLASAPRMDGSNRNGFRCGRAAAVGYDSSPRGQPPHEPDERRRPRRQREPEERARDHQQPGEVERLGETDRAQRVHPEREDHPPVLRVVGERHALQHVAPEPEEQEQRNPPGARGPEEQREAREEGPELPDEPPVPRLEDEDGARQRGDGDRPHVDPVGRAELVAGQVHEREAVEDERDDAQVPPHPWVRLRMGPPPVTAAP